MLDGPARDVPADPCGVGIEQCGDDEATAGESRITREGLSEVAEADERDPVRTVRAEGVADLLDESADVIPDAR